jgi:uncharacterized RmlC-like cupin family protein
VYQAETHETAADFVYVISGETAVVVGGTMVDGKLGGREKSVAAREWRRNQESGAGDLLDIPPKRAHWFKVDSGKQITHLVVKLESK